MERLGTALLSETERTFVHERTLWLLEHVGVSVPCERALDLLAEGGAVVDRDDCELLATPGIFDADHP